MSVWFWFGFGSVSVRFLLCHLPIPRIVCCSVPSIQSQRRRFSFIWLRFGGDFRFGQRQFRLHLASVSVVTPALLGVDLGLRFEVPVSSQVQFAAVSVSYYLRSQSADATPSRPIPPFHLVPSRSIPFHLVQSRSVPSRPVPSRSVRFFPGGLVWL